MNNIRHILLNDGAIAIVLPSGPITITPYSINYRPVRKLLESGTADVCTISTLLSEKSVNGLFFAYEYNQSLYIKQLDSGYREHYYDKHFTTRSSLPSDAVLLGVYPSKQALLNDLPEYYL